MCIRDRAEMDARIGGTPTPLPATLDPAADKFRPVTTEGRFTGRFIEVLRCVEETVTIPCAPK